jgi:hypothetical protein
MKSKDDNWVKLSPLGLNKKKDGVEKSLSWGIRMGYPRFTVFINKNNSATYDEMVITKFSMKELGKFMNRFRKVIESPKEVEYAVECLDVVYENDKKTDKTEVISEGVIKKDADGIIWFGNRDKNGDEHLFRMLPNMWHKEKINGKPLDPSVQSKAEATAYVDLLNRLIDVSLKGTLKVDKIGDTSSNNKFKKPEEKIPENKTDNKDIEDFMASN